MALAPFLEWIIMGAIAGILAGLIVKGYGFGLAGNIVVGIVGSVIGGWLFSMVGVFPGTGATGAIVSATIGAIILLLVIELIQRVD